MRSAMASADVGDDFLGEDPDDQPAFQERAAELFNRKLLSGCQAARGQYYRRKASYAAGQEIVTEERGHILTSNRVRRSTLVSLSGG